MNDEVLTGSEALTFDDVLVGYAEATQQELSWSHVLFTVIDKDQGSAVSHAIRRQRRQVS